MVQSEPNHQRLKKNKCSLRAVECVLGHMTELTAVIFALHQRKVFLIEYKENWTSVHSKPYIFNKYWVQFNSNIHLFSVIVFSHMLSIWKPPNGSIWKSLKTNNHAHFSALRGAYPWGTDYQLCISNPIMVHTFPHSNWLFSF